MIYSSGNYEVSFSCLSYWQLVLVFSEIDFAWGVGEIGFLEGQNYNLWWLIHFLIFLFYPIHEFPLQMMSFMNFHRYLEYLMDLINLLVLLNLLFLVVCNLLISFLFLLFQIVSLYFLTDIFHKFHTFFSRFFLFLIICFQSLLVLELEVFFLIREARCFFGNLRIF